MTPDLDLSALSDDELLAENERLMAARDEIREQQLAIKAVLNDRAAAVKAANLVEGLTDDEKARLGQELGLTLEVPTAEAPVVGTVPEG
jgi:hypothetical protein